MCIYTHVHVCTHSRTHAPHCVSRNCDYVHDVCRARISERIIWLCVSSSLCNLSLSSTRSLSLSLHMYIYGHIPCHFCIYDVLTYIRTHVHIYIYVCTCVHAHTYCIYTFRYMHMNICIHTCMCEARGGAATFSCVHTDRYVFVHTH